MKLEELNIETITEDEIQELGEHIFEADNGYGDFEVDEINECLQRMGLTNEEGCFLVGLTERKKQVADKLMDIIG